MNQKIRRKQNRQKALHDRKANIQYRYYVLTVWRFTKWILITIGTIAVGWFLTNVVEAWSQSRESYKIFFVGKMKDPSNFNLYEGVDTLEKDYSPTINGVSVETEHRDDYGDPYVAGIMAREISNRQDVLMVVGHGYSSTSKRALPEYLDQQPMIPVILVRETNPNLLPGFCESTKYVCPVLRLSPTDEDQATTAVEHAIREGATTFLVVRDSENPVYSNYLANQLVSEIHKSQRSVALSTIDSTVLYPDVIRKLSVDWMFFVGGYHKALILMRQMKGASRVSNVSAEEMSRSPGVTLSDMAADGELLTVGGSDVENVYLTHARSAMEISKHDYFIFGRDAAWMIDTIIREADDRLKKKRGFLGAFMRVSGMYSVSDAREEIVDVVKQFAAGKYEGSLNRSPSGKDYKFDDDENRNGRMKEGRFHVWKIKEKQFNEVSSTYSRTFSSPTR